VARVTRDLACAAAVKRGAYHRAHAWHARVALLQRRHQRNQHVRIFGIIARHRASLPLPPHMRCCENIIMASRGKRHEKMLPGTHRRKAIISSVTANDVSRKMWRINKREGAFAAQTAVYRDVSEVSTHQNRHRCMAGAATASGDINKENNHSQRHMKQRYQPAALQRRWRHGMCKAAVFGVAKKSNGVASWRAHINARHQRRWR